MVNHYRVLFSTDKVEQSAYIFVPSNKKDAVERSAKRRKLFREFPGIAPEAFVFPKLSHGREPLGLTWGRKHVFRRAWERFEGIIDVEHPLPVFALAR